MINIFSHDTRPLGILTFIISAKIHSKFKSCISQWISLVIVTTRETIPRILKQGMKSSQTPTQTQLELQRKSSFFCQTVT